MLRWAQHDKAFSGSSGGGKLSSSRRAFTLTEMLVVVILLGIMASTGIGMYAKSYKRMMVEKAARELVVMARYGQVMAVEQQTKMTIAFDPETYSFALTTVAWNPETEEPVAVVVKDYYCQPFQMHQSVMVEAMLLNSTAGAEESEELSAAGIGFYPNGTADLAVIQFGDGYQTHYTVSINPATGKAEAAFGTADQIQSKVVDLEEPQ